jgi:hypothetical protein
LLTCGVAGAVIVTLVLWAKVIPEVVGDPDRRRRPSISMMGLDASALVRVA